MEVIYTNSEQQTIELGNKIAGKLISGDVVLLEGDLGCGKTRLVKGIVNKINKIPLNKITSPTYTVVNVFKGSTTIYHLDLYRFKSEEDIFSFEFEDYLFSDGIALVEWPGILYKTLYQPSWITIKFSTISENKRKITSNLFPLD